MSFSPKTSELQIVAYVSIRISGGGSIKEPMTPEERKNREWILERLEALLEQLDDLKADLEDPDMQPYATQIREHIQHRDHTWTCRQVPEP